MSQQSAAHDCEWGSVSIVVNWDTIIATARSIIRMIRMNHRTLPTHADPLVSYCLVIVMDKFLCEGWISTGHKHDTIWTPDKDDITVAGYNSV